MNHFNTHEGKRAKPLLAVCAVCAVLAGCASTPKAPTEALLAAETAIANAEQARVADYASPELGEARDKLTAARTAVAEKEMVRAARLAEQSRADAELATAKAQAAKAQEVNDDLNKNINTLQQELQRNSGDTL
ncbi:MAG TPA: DUF4398 domain-containing protein [Cellvibrio sp.]|nr:DUF4398 domain-containing protein [Cellvibrio sp.]